MNNTILKLNSIFNGISSKLDKDLIGICSIRFSVINEHSFERLVKEINSVIQSPRAFPTKISSSKLMIIGELNPNDHFRVNKLIIYLKAIKMLLVIEQIAKTAHESIRSFNEYLGDFSIPKWGEAPTSVKDFSIQQVKILLENPGMTAEAVHNSWVESKINDGWTLGDTENFELKTHPLLILYSKLTPVHKYKDALFSVVVESMRPLYLESK